jgi:hypothetical protein
MSVRDKIKGVMDMRDEVRKEGKERRRRRGT